MKKTLSLLLCLCLMGSLVSLVSAEEAGEAQQDRLSVTRHNAVIQGREIAYTVTAGTLAMTLPQGQCDMFFTAYTLDGVEDPASRPVTFAWNGGPGAASAFVNLGFMGPERVEFDENGKVLRVPSRVIPNDCSLLDLTDLVFIDPVGTGYSRAAEGTEPKAFYSYSDDIASVSEFIRLYVSRNGRWASPKYLAGESYGTVRNAGVADYLLNKAHMALNGIMMISSANNYGADEFKPGNDLPYVSFFPTYAAIAWYHKKAADSFLAMSLEDFMREARAFAEGEYQAALFRGDRLDTEEKEALAAKMSEYIGLDRQLILRQNLRINGDTFCTGLLSDEALVVGRIDGRYSGPAVSGSMEDGDADPSMAGIVEAYTAAISDVIGRGLGYQTDLSYEILSDEVNEKWDFSPFSNRYLSQEKMIHDCMSKNPFMKVWVVCGYYDLATPFFAAEWTYGHLFLNEEFKKNLSFTYYPAGHMFYLHQASLEQFRRDAEKWFGA